MSNKQNNLKELIDFRIKKLDNIYKSGYNPFPHNYDITNSVNEIINEKDKFLNKHVNIAGRIISMRKMGKASFVHIIDNTDKIQIYLKSELLPEGVYDNIFRNLDIGDIIGVEGKLFNTKMGEFSLKSNNLTLLSKSIRPLPNLKEKDGKVFFSFDDKESKYRKRHLDLIANVETNKIFVIRAKIISQIRKYLDINNYLEVETPILQPLYGGAFARPFKTTHNSLNRSLYLRIANELYLKRLIIGGFSKVYEIGKDFRNEGIDTSHNPEFTMLEFYQAYADVYIMSEIVENMIKEIANNLKIKKIEFKGKIIYLNKMFKKINFYEALYNVYKEDIKGYSKDDLIKYIKKYNLDISFKLQESKLLEKIFEHIVEPDLIQPTFVFNYPKIISPLAKSTRENDQLIVERFELFIGGMEFANSFTELNNPLDQRKRFEEQMNFKLMGENEVQEIDENFLEAMECGMPPTGGVGIGIDRLIMLFTGKENIKDVILFPTLRTQQ